MQLLFITIAGGLGTAARYGLSTWVRSWSGEGFPWGTLVVNVIGCFLFGILLTAVRDKGLVSGQTAAIWMVGFLGAFTTFSTLAFETGDFLRSGALLPAAMNLLANVVLGLGLFFAGIWTARAALQAG